MTPADLATCSAVMTYIVSGGAYSTHSLCFEQEFWPGEYCSTLRIWWHIFFEWRPLGFVKFVSMQFKHSLHGALYTPWTHPSTLSWTQLVNC